MTGGASFLLALAVMSMVEAHDWGMGACPRVNPVPNLAVEKFLGLWYVIQQTDTDSHCLKLNYTRVSETQLRVTKLRQFGLLDQVGVEHTNSYSGTLDLPHENDLGRMRVKWPLNMAGKGDYVVFDTDYSTYAGIYECQTITTLMHRKSAAILSRQPILAQEFIDRVRRRLTSFGVSNDDLDTIVHQGCRTRDEADVNIHVDSDTFSSVMSGARTGIEEAASSVGQGFKDLASTFSWISGDAVRNVRTTLGLPSPTPNTNVVTVKDTVDKTINTGIDNVEKRFDVPVPTTTAPPNVDVTVPTTAAPRNVDITVPTTTAPPNVDVTVPTTSAPHNVDVTVPTTAAPRNVDVTVPTTTAPPAVTRGVEIALESVDKIPKDVNEAVIRKVDPGLNSANDVAKPAAGGFNDIANEIAGGEGPKETEGRNKKVNLQENFYNIDNANVEPVDDIIRTVVSIDKKK